VIAVGLACIPILASISAAYAFPIVKLCSSEFTQPTQPGQHGHYYTLGNLIGVSGQYVYVAQILTKRKLEKGAATKNGPLVYATAYIAVFPLDEIKMMAIGENASCGPFAQQGVIGTVP